MSPIESLVRSFQEFAAYVPELVQPFVVMLAGAVPFIEGEGGAAIGVVAGLHPIVAGIAAAVGNFLCVMAVVFISTRARGAVVNRRAARATVAAGGPSGPAHEVVAAADAAPPKAESKGRRRFMRWLVRFGVPGASILGPLEIPTHFTSAMLIAAGTPRGWVLLWQAVAIAIWTTVITAVVWLGVNSVVLA